LLLALVRQSRISRLPNAARATESNEIVLLLSNDTFLIETGQNFDVLEYGRLLISIALVQLEKCTFDNEVESNCDADGQRLQKRIDTSDK
jgi:hypothetical protein